MGLLVAHGILRIAQSHAEYADVAEYIRMRQSELQRVPATHRQTRHGAKLRLRLGAQRRIDRGNQILQQIVAEVLVAQQVGAVARAATDATADRWLWWSLRSVTKGHHDDHRLRLAGRDQVVEDVLRVAGGGPLIVT